MLFGDISMLSCTYYLGASLYVIKKKKAKRKQREKTLQQISDLRAPHRNPVFAIPEFSLSANRDDLLE